MHLLSSPDIADAERVGCGVAGLPREQIPVRRAFICLYGGAGGIGIRLVFIDERVAVDARGFGAGKG